MHAWITRSRWAGWLVVLGLLMGVAAVPLAVRAAAAPAICHAEPDTGLPVHHCAVCQAGVVPLTAVPPAVPMPALHAHAAGPGRTVTVWLLPATALAFTARAPPLPI